MPLILQLVPSLHLWCMFFLSPLIWLKSLVALIFLFLILHIFFFFLCYVFQLAHLPRTLVLEQRSDYTIPFFKKNFDNSSFSHCCYISQEIHILCTCIHILLQCLVMSFTLLWKILMGWFKTNWWRKIICVLILKN